PVLRKNGGREEAGRGAALPVTGSHDSQSRSPVAIFTARNWPGWSTPYRTPPSANGVMISGNRPESFMFLGPRQATETAGLSAASFNPIAVPNPAPVNR